MTKVLPKLLIHDIRGCKITTKNHIVQDVVDVINLRKEKTANFLDQEKVFDCMLNNFIFTTLKLLISMATL